MKKVLNIIFILIAILAILEFYFISGMFTAPIMMLCLVLIGAANILYSVIHCLYNEAALYTLCIIFYPVVVLFGHA